MRKHTPLPVAGCSEVLFGLAALTALAWSVPSAPADDSLAQYVPAEVGLYVELRNASDLLLPLTAPDAWLTVAELAGQPADINETGEWRARIQQTINMTPEQAIRRLFARRVAFVSEGLRRSQDAVVLCVPSEAPRDLLRGWQARPFPTSGRTSVYRLPNNVGLAVHDRLMVFGDHGSPGTFARLLRLLETGKGSTLADDPAYKSLVGRVPRNPDGVFFARFDTPPSSGAETQPQAPPLDLPEPLRGSTHVLLALHREGQLLHFSAVGDAPVSTPTQDGYLTGLVGRLPERTLLAWAGHVSYPAITQAVDSLPERNVIRIAYRVQQRMGSVQRLVDALGTSACIAAGVVTPSSRRVSAPPIPTVALLVQIRDETQVRAEWTTLFHATLALYKLLSLKVGAPHPEPLSLDVVSLEGVEAEQLDLSPLVSEHPEDTPLGELHFCWAIDGDALILASHLDWLRQIIAARHDRAPRLASVLELAREGVPSRNDSILVAQAGPIADLGSLWLEFLRRSAPAVLEQDWWRAYQPGGRNPRLGIQVRADDERRRLQILSVAPGSPAWGILKPDDEIIGCNRRRFATTQPVQEFRRGVEQRRDARWIDLYIERETVVLARRIPLPFVDPVQVLRRVVSVGRLVQRAVYSDGVPDDTGPRGSLTLELRESEKPLYAFEFSPELPPAEE